MGYDYPRYFGCRCSATFALRNERCRAHRGVLAALRQLSDVRDEIIVPTGLERMCADEDVMLGSVGMKADNPHLADRISEIADDFLDHALLARLWSAINMAHDKPDAE